MTRNNGAARSSIGTASKEARGLELYETPPVAVRALITAYPQFFGVPRRLWDPACGPGALVSELEDAGHNVFGSDLADYESRWRASPLNTPEWGRDFYSWTREEAHVRAGAEAIVMNPPYSQADLFVFHALDLVPRVYALLELRWLNGVGRDRSALIDGGHLCAVHPFDRRLKMNRDGYDGPVNRQSRLHAWYVFTRPSMGPKAPALISRLNLPPGS